MSRVSTRQPASTYNVYTHNEQSSVRFPVAKPSGAEQDDDDDSTQHHRQELRLQHREFQTVDDDVCKSAQSRRGQRRGNGNNAVRKRLRVCQSLLELFLAPLSVLKARLVASDSLYHELLVLFGPAFGAHGRVGKPVQHEDAPEKGEGTVRNEQGLPALDRTRVEKGEALFSDTC
jgi:hypothetical protein